ncbi:MAG: transcription termination/antitermination NusG family protein [Caldilineaceae bacterium]
MTTHLTTGSSNPWYVVHTRPRRELLVAGLLERVEELTLFLPEVLQPASTASKGAKKIPLFPGYLFVQVDLQSSPAGTVIHTPGVIGFVKRAAPPTGGRRGGTTLAGAGGTGQAKGGLPVHTLQPGDHVTFKAGPLQGLDGVFTGPQTPTQRAGAASLLGPATGVNGRCAALGEAEPTPAQPTNPPPRRTRGKGRTIRTH